MEKKKLDSAEIPSTKLDAGSLSLRVKRIRTNVRAGWGTSESGPHIEMWNCVGSSHTWIEVKVN